MKKNNPEIEVALKDCHDNLKNLILALLDKTNFSSKLAARDKLVSMGENILPQLHELLQSDNEDLRKEVTKTIELIANIKSIPIFITLFEDTNFDIRWIAAEGLIKTGRKSIVPLLKSIRDGKNSYFLDKGAHHVLQSLLTDTEKNDLKSLLHSLDNNLETRQTAPTEAAKALEKYWPAY